MEQPDALLVKKAKKDPQAFEALYRKYAGKVFNYFWYRTRHDRELSEDLMQETFLRAFEHLDTYQSGRSSYLTYLLTVGRNILFNHYRRPAHVPLEKHHDIPYEIMGDIEKAVEAEALWHAIQELEPKEKDLLLMFYRKEMPLKAIAKLIGKTEMATKLSLFRIRRKLRGHKKLSQIASFTDAPLPKTELRFMKI